MSEHLSEFYTSIYNIREKNQHNITFTVSGFTKESAGSVADILITERILW
jgi:hypothetical protein